MTLTEAVAALRVLGRPQRLTEYARVGIPNDSALGITIPALRTLARIVGRDHELALQLWETGIHEARLLAAFIDDPAQVTESQLERWVSDFDSWDICDGVCGLFERTPRAWAKAVEWSAREEEFVQRAAFTLVAGFAVHDKDAPDAHFLAFLPIIRERSSDDRNFVKKAVNWALRNIGKRNGILNVAAIELAEQIRADGSRAGRWIAADALRELRGEAVQARLLRRESAAGAAETHARVVPPASVRAT